MPILEIQIDDGEVIRLPMGEAPVLIGGHASADVRIDDAAVAPRHLKVSREWTIEDVSPDNFPAFLGARRITRDWLRFKEPVTIGSAGRVSLRLLPSELDGQAGEGDDALHRRLRELELERARLVEEIDSLKEAIEGAKGAAADESQSRKLQRAAHWIESMDLPIRFTDEEVEELGLDGVEERVQLLVQLLLDFIADLEDRTNRVLKASGREGETNLFDRRSLRRQISKALRSNDADEYRRQIREQLDFMARAWISGTLKVYRQGVEVWAQEFLNRLAPKAIQMRANVSDARLDLGLGYKKLWSEYRRFIFELTSNVLVEEVDSAVSKTLNDVS